VENEGMENAGVENAGVNSRVTATDELSKNCRKENQFSTFWTFAFRPIESLGRIVSNNYSETKSQRLGIL